MTVGGFEALEDPETVASTLVWSPNVGEEVRVIDASSMPVSDDSYAFEVLTQEFVRGVSGQAQLVFHNTADVEVEIVLGKGIGSSPSDEVRFTLLDSDDNVLAVTAVKQFLGDSLVTLANGLSVARVAPAGSLFVVR